MSKATILPCTCQHAYQDRVHGRGKRVHNYRDKYETWVCTVCRAQKGEERNGRNG